MKAALFIAALALAAGPVMAEQTVGEKVEATGAKAKAKVKKGWNRTKEAVCMEGDVECAAKKAKNRVGEGVDAAKDKAGEVKDKVD